jgi:hypothetical protein
LRRLFVVIRQAGRLFRRRRFLFHDIRFGTTMQLSCLALPMPSVESATKKGATGESMLSPHAQNHVCNIVLLACEPPVIITVILGRAAPETAHRL